MQWDWWGWNERWNEKHFSTSSWVHEEEANMRKGWQRKKSSRSKRKSDPFWLTVKLPAPFIRRLLVVWPWSHKNQCEKQETKTKHTFLSFLFFLWFFPPSIIHSNTEHTTAKPLLSSSMHWEIFWVESETHNNNSNNVYGSRGCSSSRLSAPHSELPHSDVNQ